MSNQLTKVQTAVASIRSIVESDGYRARFESMLGKRAPQFIASISNIVAQSDLLADCDPRSVILSAVMAATLDLPIEKSLGFAYIVPYKTTATFQIGYRGLIQLALRSGQYQSMREACVNKDAFKGFDDIGEPIIDWAKLDEGEKPVGYAFVWRMLNGFKKTVYWSTERCHAHGKKFSKTYGRDSSPWTTNPDAMCLKTVIRSALSHYGMLSVDMQRAIVADDIELEADANGNLVPKVGPLGTDDLTGAAGAGMGDKRTLGQKLKEKNVTHQSEPGEGGAGSEGTAGQPEGAGEKGETEQNQEPEKKETTAAGKTDAPAPKVDRDALIETMQNRCMDLRVTETKLFTYAKGIPGLVPRDIPGSVWELPTDSLVKLEPAIKALAKGTG